MSMYDLVKLFFDARRNPKNPMNRPGRLMGKRCRVKLDRSIAKNAKKPGHRKHVHAQAPDRKPAPFSQPSPKIDGVRYRYEGERGQSRLVPR